MARPYYGWVLVLTLAVTETTSWGVLYYAFTVFLTPMQETFGWSRAAMTGAFSVALLVLSWAAVQNLAMLYLVWAGIGVTMAAVLYEPAFVVVATWFRQKRGRALTMLTFIAGFASVIYIPLAGWLVSAQGW